MERSSGLRGYQVVAISFAIALVVSLASSWVVFGEGDDVAIYACLSPSGQLTAVTTEGPPDCKGQSVPISWNQIGPAGEKGDKGDQGDPGPPGPTNLVIRTSTVSLPVGLTWSETVNCLENEVATGGGASGFADANSIVRSRPSTGDGTTPVGWTATVRNESGFSPPLSVYVICASYEEPE